MAELNGLGLTRRDFLSYCAMTAASLALPARAAEKIAESLESGAKPVVIWLELQDCAGNTESFLRASRPSISTIILDVISVDYQETIMAAAGKRAEEARAKAMADHRGKYIAIVEGSIPLANDGYCTVGGRSARDIAREVCGGAAGVIAIGDCATYGGIPAAAPNPTGAVAVEKVLDDTRNLVNLPACPANVDNLTALIVHRLTFNDWPLLDRLRRPLFAYGTRIHDACERRSHFNAGEFVEAWGDERHRAGYCLYKMGCKGPVTYQNCPAIRWNEHTSWPVGCGHPCVGCAEPGFWDDMSPFYRHLPDVPVASASIDTVGAIATAGVAAAFAAHGALSYVRYRRARQEAQDARAEERGSNGRKGEA